MDEPEDAVSQERTPGSHDDTGKADRADAVTDAISDIHIRLTTLERLTSSVEDLALVARRREEHFRELHAETQRLRSAQADRVFLPIFRDLISLYDQLLTAGYSDFATIVLAILERYGVEIYEPPTGAPFDPKRQRGLGAEPTSDSLVDRTVCRVQRAGFVLEDFPIRPADVIVYTLVSDSITSSGEPPQEGAPPPEE